MTNIFVKINDKWEQLELFDDENIQIELKLEDLKELEKAYSTFTHQFVIPCSSLNDSLLNYYYDSNISNKKQSFESMIMLDDEVYKTGRLVINNAAFKYNNQLTYQVSFYSGLMPIKDRIGDDGFDVIDFSYEEFDWTFPNVYGRIMGGVSPQKIMFPLISNTRIWNIGKGGGGDIATPITTTDANSSNGINISELQPAIQLKYLFEKVCEHYDITINNQFENLTWFNKIYVYLNQKESQQTVTQLFISNNFVESYNQQDPNANITQFTRLAKDNNGNLIINEGIYKRANNYITVRVENLIDSTTGNAVEDVKLRLSELDDNDMIINEFDIDGSGGLNPEFRFEFENRGRNRKFKMELITDNNVTFNKFSLMYSPFYTYNSGGTSFIGIQNFLNYSVNNTQLTTNNRFKVNNYLKNTKIIDFLSAMVRTFNLKTIDLEDGTYNMNWKNFIDLEEMNINDYVAVDDYTVDSIEKYKNITLTHSEEDYYRNVKFRELMGYEYGTEKYNSDNLDFTEDYEVESGFSIMSYFKLLNSNIITSYAFDDGFDSVSPSTLTLMMINDIEQISCYVDEVEYKIMLRYGTQKVRIDSYRPFTNVDTNSELTQRMTLTFNQEVLTNGEIAKRTLYSQLFKWDFLEKYAENNYVYNYTGYFPPNVLKNIDMEKMYVIADKVFKPYEISSNLMTGESTLKLLNYNPIAESTYQITPPTLLTIFATTVNTITIAFNGSYASDGVAAHEIQWRNTNAPENYSWSTAIMAQQADNQVSYIYQIRYPQGCYNIRVRTLSMSGVQSEWRTIVGCTADVQPPTPPTLLTAGDITSTSINVIFNGSTPGTDSAVAGHEINYRIVGDINWQNTYVDAHSGNQVSYVTTLSNLVSESEYEIRIRTKTNAGNYSVWKTLTPSPTTLAAPTNQYPTVPELLNASAGLSTELRVQVGLSTTPAPSTLATHEVQIKSTTSSTWIDTNVLNLNGTQSDQNTRTTFFYVGQGNYNVRARTKNNLGNYSPWKTLGYSVYIPPPGGGLQPGAGLELGQIGNNGVYLGQIDNQLVSNVIGVQHSVDGGKQWVTQELIQINPDDLIYIPNLPTNTDLLVRTRWMVDDGENEWVDLAEPINITDNLDPLPIPAANLLIVDNSLAIDGRLVGGEQLQVVKKVGNYNWELIETIDVKDTTIEFEYDLTDMAIRLVSDKNFTSWAFPTKK